MKSAFKRKKEEKKRKKDAPTEPSLVWGITRLDDINYEAGQYLLTQCISWLESHECNHKFHCSNKDSYFR